MICLSVSLVGPTKILNMSNNAGRPPDAFSFGHCVMGDQLHILY